jgi:hypothetical protein
MCLRITRRSPFGNRTSPPMKRATSIIAPENFVTSSDAFFAACLKAYKNLDKRGYDIRTLHNQVHKYTSKIAESTVKDKIIAAYNRLTATYLKILVTTNEYEYLFTIAQTYNELHAYINGAVSKLTRSESVKNYLIRCKILSYEFYKMYIFHYVHGEEFDMRRVDKALDYLSSNIYIYDIVPVYMDPLPYYQLCICYLRYYFTTTRKRKTYYKTMVAMHKTVASSSTDVCAYANKNTPSEDTAYLHYANFITTKRAKTSLTGKHNSIDIYSKLVFDSASGT